LFQNAKTAFEISKFQMVVIGKFSKGKF